MTDDNKENKENETDDTAEDEPTTVDAEIVEDQPEALEELAAAIEANEEPTEETPSEEKSGSSLPLIVVAAVAAVIVGTVIVVSNNTNMALVDEDGIVVADAPEETTILFPTPRTAEGPIETTPPVAMPMDPEEAAEEPATVSEPAPVVVAEADEPLAVEATAEPEVVPDEEPVVVPAGESVAPVEMVAEVTPVVEEVEPETSAAELVAALNAAAAETAMAEEAAPEEVIEDVAAEAAPTDVAEVVAEETAAAEEATEVVVAATEEDEAERQAALIAAAEAEEQAARERIAGLRRLAEERAAERRAVLATTVAAAPAPQPEPQPIPAPVEPTPAAAPAPVAVIPEEQIETLRREIVENVATIVETASVNVREGVKSEVLAQTEEVIDTRFAETQAQVAQTQAQLQQTEQVIGSQLSQTQAALQQTERRLTQIQQSLNAQQQTAQAQISQLDTRIEQLQTRDVAVAQRGALLIAVTELGDRIDAGQPFRRQLNAIEAITGGRTELTELRPFADGGLPSNDAMRASFDEAARAALAGAKRDQADTVFEKFLANLTGLFTIRPVGEAEGDSVGAVIARAEQRLEGGDLNAAAQELSQLDGSAETAFADWVATAEAKATASRGLRALEQQVTAPRRG